VAAYVCPDVHYKHTGHKEMFVKTLQLYFKVHDILQKMFPVI